MKINRYRKVQRILKFYSNNFGFRKPYQLLLDGTICVTALKYKINIQEQFTKYLEGDAKLLTTQCIVKELENLGPVTYGALVIIKKFGIHKCGHEKSPVSASDCIVSMIGEKNSSRYIIATQDRDLQQKCRKIQGVPLLYLHMRTPTLETPSALTQDAVNEKTLENFQVNKFEREKLKRLNKCEVAEEEPVRKKKKKGGPNPLSCKKKKKKVENNGRPKTSDENKKKKKKKRKRNRSVLVKKIKSEILGSLKS